MDDISAANSANKAVLSGDTNGWTTENISTAADQSVLPLFDADDDDSSESDSSLNGDPRSDDTPEEDCPCPCGGPKGACRAWTIPASPLHRIIVDPQTYEIQEHLWITNPEAIKQEERLYLNALRKELRKRLKDLYVTLELPRCVQQPAWLLDTDATIPETNEAWSHDV